MLLNKFLFQHDESGHHCCESDHDHSDQSEDSIIEIVDPDTDEVYEFYIGDEFEHEDKLYYVLVTIEEDPVYVIARVVEQDGEAYIETLTDEENDELYEVYDKILEEAFDDEE